MSEGGWNTTVIVNDRKHLRVMIAPWERCPCLRFMDQVRIQLTAPSSTSLEGTSANQDVFISLLGRWRIRRAVREYMFNRVVEQLYDEETQDDNVV